MLGPAYKTITDWDKVPVLVDYAYVCNLFRVTEPTVRKWVKEGKIKARKIGHQVRFAKEDLMEFGRSA